MKSFHILHINVSICDNNNLNYKLKYSMIWINKTNILIDCFVFYVVSAIFWTYNGG